MLSSVPAHETSVRCIVLFVFPYCDPYLGSVPIVKTISLIFRNALTYLEYHSLVVCKPLQHLFDSNQSQIFDPIDYQNKFQLFLHSSIDFQLIVHHHRYSLYNTKINVVIMFCFVYRIHRVHQQHCYESKQRVGIVACYNLPRLSPILHNQS